MGIRSKTFLSVLIVGLVITAISIQSGNVSFFKGQLKKNAENIDEKSSDETSGDATTAPLPDLTVDLTVEPPENTNGDLKANVVISNNGPGAILGNKPFKYTIFINEVEVFTNTDSYTVMNAGDSFNFKYPISKLIYNYGSEGKVKVVVDTENTIEEVDEQNNENEVDYSIQ